MVKMKKISLLLLIAIIIMPPKQHANKNPKGKNGSLPQPVVGGGAHDNPQVDQHDCERQPGEVELVVQGQPPLVVVEDEFAVQAPPPVALAAAPQQPLVALVVQVPPQVAPAAVQPNFFGGSFRAPVLQFRPDPIGAANILRSLDCVKLGENANSSHQKEPKHNWGLCGGAKKGVPKERDECRFSHSPKDLTDPISFLLKSMNVLKRNEVRDLQPMFKDLFGHAEMSVIEFFRVRESAKKGKSTKKEQSPFPFVDDCLTRKVVTSESFIKLFNLKDKKNEARDAENLRIFSYFLVKYIESRPQNEFPDRCTTVDEMKFFHLLKLLGSLNENLFDQSKPFLNDLALKLLMEVGADAPALTFDSGNDLGKVCMAMLIFKHIVANEEEEEEECSQLSIRLFRALRECLDKENESFVKFCFDDDDDLKRFNLQLTFASAGAAHNSILSCGAIQSKMIDLPDAYNRVFSSVLRDFLWKSPTGSGKSTAMLLTTLSKAAMSHISQPAKTGCDVIYFGPDTGTVDPTDVETICEVIRMHFEKKGLECPRFNIIQCGAIPTKSSTQVVVNIYLMNHFSECLPLLCSSNSDYIVGFDDNNGILPCDVIHILGSFPNVKQIHLTGATLDMTGLDGIPICEIGQGLTRSVSSINATFIHDGISLSPNQLRLFRNSRLKMMKKLLERFGCFPLPHSLEIKELCREYQKQSQPLLECLEKLDFLSRVSGKEPSCSLQNFMVLMKHLSFEFPPYQLGKPYSTEELASMSIPAFKVVNVLRDMGFEFNEPTLQFPKDASASERQAVIRKEFKNLRNGVSSPIFVFDGEEEAHVLCSVAEEYSFQQNLSIKSSGGGVLPSGPEDLTDGHKKRMKKGEKEEKDLKSKDKKTKVSTAAAGAADDGANDVAADDDAADDAADAVAADADADAAAAAGYVDADADADELNVTFKDKLNRLVKDLRKRMTDARVGIPTDKDVEEALAILLTCKHPDAIRWLRQFMLGICLFDRIMPTEFISKCYKMFENGRMGMFLVRKIFHVQSWNPKCVLGISITVCSAVPSRFLFQTVARAGRINDQNSGKLDSLVSSIIRPELKQFSQDDFPVVLPGQNFQSVVDVLTNMVKSRLFTDRDRNWVVRFLDIFMFAYKDPACKSACEGGNHYMGDFLNLLSGALTSIFASPFNCSFDRVDEELQRIAISKFISRSCESFDAKCRAFEKGMKAVVSQKELMMSFGLSRAVEQKKLIGINVSDLPLFFKELYEGYPDSFMHLLKCIQTLLMNVQTTKSFLREDAMISSMLLVISKTIEYVSNILEFLANLLREKDMERFRVGYVQKSDPMDELRAMFQMPVQPTVQELHAFLSRHQSYLPGLWTLFCDLEAYLLPNPSGPYHDRSCRLLSLQQTFAGCKAQIMVEEKRKSTKPNKEMTIREFAAHKETAEYLSMCQVADATIEVLSKQCQELQGEIDHLARELGILPHQLTGIVPYIKNLV
jgi:hypothetical protein